MKIRSLNIAAAAAALAASALLPMPLKAKDISAKVAGIDLSPSAPDVSQAQFGGGHYSHSSHSSHSSHHSHYSSSY